MEAKCWLVGPRMSAFKVLGGEACSSDWDQSSELLSIPKPRLQKLL